MERERVRIDVQECHEDIIRRFFSDGTIDEVPYSFDSEGLRIVDIDPNNEIFQ